MIAKKIKIGEISHEVTKGTTPTTLGFNYKDSGIPFIRATNLGEKYVNFKEDVLYIDQEANKALGRSVLLPGDLLISIAGTIGEVSIVPDDAPLLNCNQAVCLIRLKDTVDRNYLRHWFSSIDAKKQIQNSKVTGVISNLSLGQIKNLELALPTLAEQRRIAAILDKAESLRAKRREAIDKLDQLLQSVFFDFFGDPVKNSKNWELKKISDVASFITSGSRGWAKYYSSHGDKFIRIQNLVEGELDISDCAYVNAPNTAEARRTKLNEGDILISITADLGRIAVVPHGLGDAYINQHIAIVRTNIPNKSFLANYLSSPGGKMQFAKLNKGGVKAGLNFDDIKNLKFPNPPEKLQKKFTDAYSFIIKEKKKMIFQNNEIDQLNKSLLNTFIK